MKEAAKEKFTKTESLKSERLALLRKLMRKIFPSASATTFIPSKFGRYNLMMNKIKILY